MSGEIFYLQDLIEKLLWYVLPNVLLNLMTSFWLFGQLRGRRRLGEDVAVWPWVIYSLVIGMVLPFVTGPLATTAWHDAKRRGHNPKPWLVLCTLFSFIGYIGYWVYDDACSRNMAKTAWAVVTIGYYSLILIVWPILIAKWAWMYNIFMLQLLITIPVIVLLIIGFPIVYAAIRTRLRYEAVRRRFAAMGKIEPTDGRLVVVDGLKTYFPVRGGVFSTIRGYVRAVDGVTFDVKRGEAVGLVGESGCGKTTAGRTILGLIKSTGGRVLFDGLDLSLLNSSEMRALRSQIQVIFQDPIGSLNPRMTVGSIVGEGLTIHSIGTPRERREKVAELLERVGLPREAVNRYPHEFSGGQRQRIGIARALALGAEFIVCDEPVSALDVSIQAQIINLLDDLRRDFKISYLFIAHDLAVVEHIADRVIVMYLGRVAEFADGEELYRRPLHPYTKALMSAIPIADPKRRREKVILGGDIPSPVHPPSGCRFRTRCPMAIERCAEVEPPLVDYGNGHKAACIRIPEWIDQGGPKMATAETE